MKPCRGEKPPFRITPDTRVFFEGCNRGAVLQALCFAISSGEGIVKVVGEVGSGKTMLCRMLPQKLAQSVDWVYLAHPRLEPEQMLQEIARELDIPLSPSDDKLMVMREIQAGLLSRHAQNRHVVVLAEEAQEMPLATLEELRLLTNLETDEHKLLQIVLFGQPELDENLSARRIRQLRERITHSIYLDPLVLEDVHAYVNFRVRACGYRGPELFHVDAAEAILRYSRGLHRRINILADKAMMAAYSRGTKTLSLMDIERAAQDSQYTSKSRWWSKESAV